MTTPAYDEARAKLQATAERRGFEPEPQGLEDETGPMCPVGYCHPGTAQSLRARPSGLCGRHWRKISPPLQRQLQGAQARGEAAVGMLEQAVLEARRLDDKWHPFAVIVGDVAEPYDSHERAVIRHHQLGLEGKLVALQSSKRGLLTAHQIRAYSPHEVIDGYGNTIASGKTLAKAVAEAHRRYYDEAANTGAPTWPGEPPTVVNGWTGEELAWGWACEVAARGDTPKGEASTRPYICRIPPADGDPTC